ncbi:MAG: hypothetical protein K0R21_940 [Anaerocolumna sp.]|jgi:lysophospholipase L1-like esterase|nr:hypothetical protein [Anaerocolumna sp.]
MDSTLFADKGIVSLGNLYRMSKVMKKALNGEDITLGFFGGSITQGAQTTAHENCYAYLVYQWWVNKFPKSKVTYVNCGVGGTTSQFGVARVDNDLLQHNPDFVITEFSVNDKDEDLFLETYEGLIRKVLLHTSEPAVLILNNVRYHTGINAQRIHNQVGAAYELPMVSMKDSLYPEVESGRIPVADITEDFLHPNDLGHKLVSETVNNALEKIYEKVIAGDIDATYLFPNQTITQNRFINSIRYNNKNCKPIVNGFTEDLTEQAAVHDKFKNGWIAKKVGTSIQFTINCRSIAVQYCKSPRENAPLAKVIIDGDTQHPYMIDAGNSTTKGDNLYLQTLIVEDESKVHDIIISVDKIEEAMEDKFYLASIIVA